MTDEGFEKISATLWLINDFLFTLLCFNPGGSTPYNGLYGEVPPERGTFFRLEVYKRLGISTVM